MNRLKVHCVSLLSARNIIHILIGHKTLGHYQILLAFHFQVLCITVKVLSCWPNCQFSPKADVITCHTYPLSIHCSKCKQIPPVALAIHHHQVKTGRFVPFFICGFQIPISLGIWTIRVFVQCFVKSTGPQSAHSVIHMLMVASYWIIITAALIHTSQEKPLYFLIEKSADSASVLEGILT